MPTRSPSSPSPPPTWPGRKAQGDGGGSTGTPESLTSSGTFACMPDHPMNERIGELVARKEQARQAGSQRAVQRQHERGKMTARERVEYLLDEGSFQELDMLARHRVGENLPERPYTDGIITGFGFMVRGKAFMFIPGPGVVESVTGEGVTHGQLGGAMTHATRSGVCTFVAPDDKAGLEDVRYLLSFLPSNNLEEPPWVEPT